MFSRLNHVFFRLLLLPLLLRLEIHSSTINNGSQIYYYNFWFINFAYHKFCFSFPFLPNNDIVPRLHIFFSLQLMFSAGFRNQNCCSWWTFHGWYLEAQLDKLNDCPWWYSWTKNLQNCIHLGSNWIAIRHGNKNAKNKKLSHNLFSFSVIWLIPSIAIFSIPFLL